MLLLDQELQSLRNMGNESETAADEIAMLRASLNEVVNHWREFGPDHGFDECIERAAGRRAVLPYK